jgi:hypothetical protein
MSGLVAYPSEPADIGRTISRSLEKLHQQDSIRQLLSWEESDIPGRFISTEVLKNIESGTIFIADITRLNFNVVFEIGYAIGYKKRAILVRNEVIRPDSDLIRSVGIFDTLGYAKYTDSSSLVSIISEITDLNPLHFDENDTSTKTPVYLLLPQMKGDIETHLIARLKKGRLFYRSFDPEEHVRLSALEAIENVSISHGVVIPLLPTHYSNSEIHNIRAAFVAGLAQGMRKLLLFLQTGDDPIPLDYRDLVSSFKFPNQIDEYVHEFGIAITESLESEQPSVVTQPSTFLTRLTLGASSAENEFQELGKYYLETDEYRRALRGEVQIVLGRKGSGKTALFFQVRDRLRSDTKAVVLDLKPEGFQLIKFKDQVLDYLEEGTREHTITAFWEYLLLLEICHKLIQTDRSLHLRDHELYSPYRSLESTYDNDEYVSEGDFAERMLKLTQRIAQDFATIRKNAKDSLRLSNEEITQFLYIHNVSSLRSKLISYLQHKKALLILFDNLDKGWPPHGIQPEDVLSLRCLLDAMDKLERSFRRQGIPTTGIIFIRNDVYENLVAAMPDRGKISHALVDWTDVALLLELLRRRFLSSDIEGDPSFENIWRQVCISHIKGEETSHYMAERCLMRPRSLIDFLRFCRSHAVNLRHKRIEIEDIEQGEEQYSTQLVNDISYEIQDVFPPAKDSLYEFIESPSELDSALLSSILANISEDIDTQEKIFDLLLWYGVIGFRRIDGESTYIYSVRYDIKRLKSLLKKREEKGIVYLINPAFWKGLEINTQRTHSS